MKKLITLIVVFMIAIHSFGEQICVAFDFNVADEIQKMIDKGYKVVCMATAEIGYPKVVVVFEKDNDEK